MPFGTPSEQQDWHERLAAKIERTIATILASEPGLGERLRQQARQRALQSLGLADLQAQLEVIATQQQELGLRRRQLYQAMLATLRRVPLAEVSLSSADSLPAEVVQAIQQRQALHEEELLAAEQHGQPILALRRERENLRETLWLATAPGALQDLWQHVMVLLGEERTALQQEVLAHRVLTKP